MSVLTSIVSKLDPLVGLTRKECPKGCTPDHCVISQSAICGHPMKGSHMHAAPDRDRVEEAKRRLNHQVRRQ